MHFKCIVVWYCMANVLSSCFCDALFLPAVACYFCSFHFSDESCLVFCLFILLNIFERTPSLIYLPFEIDYSNKLLLDC